MRTRLPPDPPTVAQGRPASGRTPGTPAESGESRWPEGGHAYGRRARDGGGQEAASGRTRRSRAPRGSVAKHHRRRRAARPGGQPTGAPVAFRPLVAAGTPGVLAGRRVISSTLVPAGRAVTGRLTGPDRRGQRVSPGVPLVRRLFAGHAGRRASLAALQAGPRLRGGPASRERSVSGRGGETGPPWRSRPPPCGSAQSPAGGAGPRCRSRARSGSTRRRRSSAHGSPTAPALLSAARQPPRAPRSRYRRFGGRAFTIDELNASGVLPAPAADRAAAALRSGCKLLISGGTGSGRDALQRAGLAVPARGPRHL